MGYGPTAAPLSGLASLTGYPDDGKAREVGIAFGDPAAGIQAALGVVAALVGPGGTGRGQRIDVSLWEATAVNAGRGLDDLAAHRGPAHAARQPGPVLGALRLLSGPGRGAVGHDRLPVGDVLAGAAHGGRPRRPGRALGRPLRRQRRAQGGRGRPRPAARRPGRRGGTAGRPPGSCRRPGWPPSPR